MLGRIPTNKLYGPGMAILNQYPPRTILRSTGRAYNYTTTIPVSNQLSYTPVVRIDWQASEKLRVTWK